jgi:hypothetical protein
MPIIAIRHKIKKVSHYVIVTDRFERIETKDYILALTCFDLLIELDLYGEKIEILEFYKNGSSESCKKLEW